MKTTSALALAMAAALPVAAQAQAPGGKSAPQVAADRLVVMPASGLTWSDLDPGAPGVELAVLWGNPGTGAFGAFFRLPAGFAAPLHTHTHDMKVVIVSGTYIQAPAGKPEFRLGPGSYFMQPGGDYQHTTSCDAASDCVFFVESGGAFDLKLVEAAKAPSR